MPEAPAALTGRFVTANHWRIPPWDARIDRIAALMTSANAHVFGTQETEEIAEKGILAKIEPAGTFKVFSDRSNITLLGRGDQFEVLWHDEYSVPADNRSRHHQAALLRHIETGVEFLAVNTHFSNGSAWAAVRVRHAQAIVAMLGQLTLEGVISPTTPVVLMGDFNDKRRANVHGPAREFKAAGLIDARDVIGFKPTSIDLVYGRNIVFKAWSKIETGLVSDHDWFCVTADVGLGAPKPPPPVPVTMWVRPVGDPIWGEEPFEIKSRGANGQFTDKVRPAGFRIIGTVVDLKLPDGTVDKFVRTESQRHYRLSFLTTEAPA